MTTLFPSATAKADVSVDDAPSQTEGMIWIPGGTFPHGIGQALSGRSPGAPRHSGRLLDGPPSRDEPAIQEVRQGYRPRHRRRDYSRSKRLSRNATSYGLRGLPDVLAAQPSGRPPR